MCACLVVTACTGNTKLPAHIDIQGMTPTLVRRSGSGSHKAKVNAMVYVHGPSKLGDATGNQLHGWEQSRLLQ